MSEEREASRLAKQLAALPAPEMRHHALLRYLAETPPEAAVPVLSRIQLLGRQGGPPFDVALLAMAGLLSHELLPYERIAELYRAAKEAGQDALGQLFFSGSSEGPAHEPRRRDDQRELTLGHRKTLARLQDRQVLDRLLHDPEVPVIRNLLLNPRLVERDVVQLAARRPTDPEVQRAIFAAPRWIRCYAVKRALVLNPYSPTELSIRLLGFLTLPDLKSLGQTPTLPLVVRDAAQELIRSKGWSG